MLRSLIPCALFIGSLAVTCLPIFTWNYIHYGDVLAQRASLEHIASYMPALINPPNNLLWFFYDIPKEFAKSFWYTSGHNQFNWDWRIYFIPWTVFFVGFGAFLWTLFKKPQDLWSSMCLLLIFAAGLASVFIAATNTTQIQGRYAFCSLPALAMIFCLGCQNLNLPKQLGWLLVGFNLISILISIKIHIIDIYY